MPISTTLRQFDGDIWINADGIRTDRHGIPLTEGEGGGGGITTGVVPPEGAVEGSTGDMYYDTTNQTLWIKTTESGTEGWTQLI